MSTETDELVKAFEELPEIEKFETISRLLDQDKRLSARWNEEIQRRLELEEKNEFEAYSYAKVRKDLEEKILVKLLTKEADNIYVFTISFGKRLVIKRDYCEELKNYTFDFLNMDLFDTTFIPYYALFFSLIDEYEKSGKLDLPMELRSKYSKS